MAPVVDGCETGVSVSDTGIVTPAVTVTGWVASSYPDIFTTTVCDPGVIPVNVVLVTCPVLTPSRYTIAPVGTELTEMAPVVGAALPTCKAPLCRSALPLPPLLH